jgi:GTP-binding protein Era
MDNIKTRCGAVTLIGLPNAGKSTLVNALVGGKVSIVSRKVQTTRMRVVGITAYEEAQIILIDTPGVFEPKKTIEKAMVSAALDALHEGDVILHIVDVSDRKVLAHNQIIHRSLPAGVPVVLVFNKVDCIAKEELLALAAAFNEVYDYKQTFMISALKKSGLPALMKGLAAFLPEEPWRFDEDQMTTMPMRLLAAEITREKVFEQLHQELPYSIFVQTEAWEDFDNGDVRISQMIIVDKDSQKGIVLGKQGSRIKQIGEAARKDIEEIMGVPVHIKLFVKVQQNWQEKAEHYQSMGLNFSA